MRRDKYSPDINFEAVSTYVREHTRSTGYRAVILLLPGRGPGGADMVEVRLVPEASPDTTPTPIITRGPFPTKRIGAQMSVLLHLVAQAYQELDTNPWLWSPEKRRAARGESA